jgi:hypothetical protein
MSEAKPGGDPAGRSDPTAGGEPYASYANGAPDRPRSAERQAPTDTTVPPEDTRPRSAYVDDRPRRTYSPYTRAAVLTLLLLAGLMFLALLLNGVGVITLPGSGAAAVPTRELLLNETPVPPLLGGGAGSGPAVDIPPPGPPPGPPPPVAPLFEGFYATRAGDRILGRPIAPPAEVNGRLVQWFERGRMEHWPEFAGTPYEVQLGRVGVEYTDGRTFPQQSYFISTPELRFFPETGHGVGGAFLRFYDAYGGLDAFGFPISDEFDEVLPDGRMYRVQYFERARMEFHPELAGTPFEVQLGLLGDALLSNAARPTTVPPAPTPVP